jgi:hypothetical protein
MPSVKAPARRRPAKAEAADLPNVKNRDDLHGGLKLRSAAPSASERIDAKVMELGGWRGEFLSRLRALIHEADPEVTEEWKWSTPVWSHGGILCTGETYKKVVKMTFAKGASLPDPSKLFNASLEGKVRRAIDFHEGASLDEAALKDLIRAAVALNTAAARR